MWHDSRGIFEFNSKECDDDIMRDGLVWQFGQRSYACTWPRSTLCPIMPQLATIYHQCPDIDLLCANKHGWLGKCPRRLGLMNSSKD